MDFLIDLALAINDTDLELNSSLNNLFSNFECNIQVLVI